MPPQTSQILTPEITDRIAAAVAAGATVDEVAVAEGIHRSTFMAWMQAGREAEEGEANDFSVLYQRVTQARAQCRVRAEILVRQRDPKFYLTHSPPSADERRWVSSDRMQVQVGVGLTVESMLTGAYEILAEQGQAADPLTAPDSEQVLTYLGAPPEA